MSIAAFGGLVSGFNSGLSLSADMKERKQDRDDREADRIERQQRSAAEKGLPGAPIEVEGGTSDGGDARPYKTSDPVLEGLAPHQKAFLNAIAGGESGGNYSVRFTPAGGTNFEGFDKHPGIMEPGPHGPSSAAGRYQFTKSTWDEMGGGSFTPDRQDMRALKLASSRYRAITGRNLDQDLMASGLTNEIMTTLAPTWQAFTGAHDRHIATYNDSLARYGRTAEAPPPAAAGGMPEPETEEWGTMKRIMTS